MIDENHHSDHIQISFMLQFTTSISKWFMQSALDEETGEELASGPRPMQNW